MEAHTKPSVLVVDDERQVLVAVEDVLMDSFRVFTAESAERALATLEREREIAVVITDQRMPRMTGDELLVKIRDTSSATSILLTGFADLTAVIRAVNEGRIFAYVTKPWNAEDLRLKVGKAAEHFELSKHLAYERQLLHDLMDGATDAIYFKDTDLRFLRVNSAFLKFGAHGDAADVHGKRLAELGVDPETAEAIESEERALLERGHSLSDRVYEMTAGGKLRWFSVTKAPIESNGKVIGLVAIERDITERVRSGEALVESERRLRDQSQLLNSILDCMGEGVIVADRSGKFVLFNRQAEVLLGRGAADIPATQWTNTYGLFLRDQITPLATPDNPLIRAMSGERVDEAELFVQNAVIPGASVAMSATPLWDHREQLVGGIGVLRDVTRQKRLEQQLTQSQKMEAIGLLAGGVAHDFNNLLAVISSYGELVFHDLPPGDPARDDVGEMLEAARRASSLTRQLLAFSRRQVVEAKILDLNAIVSDSEKMLRRILGEDVELLTDLAPSLGSIKADAGQLEQIVLNLAVNARDAMPDGGKLTIITADVELDGSYAATHAGVEPGDYVLLSVADDGCGMDATTRARIFEPFFTTKEVGKGTGLGLSTVYGIVTQSGGHVDVKSEVGVGTEFRIYFPSIDASVDSQRRERKVASDESGPATILLVEDDEAVRRIAARILRQRGYDVLESRSPKDAQQICAEKPDRIDLLLTDVVMPDMSGPKLAEMLVKTCPRMRVLYMSGYPGGAPHRGKGFEAHGPLLSKPFTPASLAEKVREVLELPYRPVSFSEAPTE
jgi:PAS domain S-box-containing protein